MIRNFFCPKAKFSSATPSVTLYYSQYSPPARAAYMVAKALNLNVIIKDSDILSRDYLTPDLLKINPQHTIPTLQDGDFVLWDSHAIAGYLVGQYGKDDSLYPTDPKKRAIVDQRLHFDTEVLFPKTFEIFHPLLFRGRTMITSHTRSGVSKAYQLLDKFLKNSTWLAGDDLTIADLCCVASISTLDYLLPISGVAFPQLYLFLERCTKLPYYNEINQTGVDNLGSRIQERLIMAYIKHYATK